MLKKRSVKEFTRLSFVRQKQASGNMTDCLRSTGVTEARFLKGSLSTESGQSISDNIMAIQVIVAVAYGIVQGFGVLDFTVSG